MTRKELEGPKLGIPGVFDYSLAAMRLGQGEVTALEATDRQ
jgi:hypothetical protein